MAHRKFHGIVVDDDGRRYFPTSRAVLRETLAGLIAEQDIEARTGSYAVAEAIDGDIMNVATRINEADDE